MGTKNLYKAIGKADQLNKEGGYKNIVLWAPRDTFSAMAIPTSLVALGDRVTISGNHTFSADEGFISWLCKKNSVTITAGTTGDAGAKSFVWESKFILLGDSASTQQQLEDMLNDEVIFLMKDADCLNATGYTQLGDDCNTPEVDVKFDGKTTAEGLKEYEVSLKVKSKKYWYNGTVTEKPSYELGPILNNVIGPVLDVSVTMNWDDVPGATGYDLDCATSTSFTTNLGGGVTSSNGIILGLTANTNYYFRIRAKKVVGSVTTYGPYTPVMIVKTDA